MGKTGVKRLAAAAAILWLASCAAPPVAPRAPPPPPPAPPRPATAPVLHPTADQCGADDLQSVVGRPKTEIPIPLQPGLRRVVCTTCPMTEDYRPERQTILFDPATGVVTSVKCG
jgi:hypothetical protein